MQTMSIDRLVGLLCVLVASLALADTAMAEADEWGGWNDVPDDLLEMTDETSMRELSERLDQLVRTGDESEVTGDLPEDVLDRWLNLLSTPRGDMDVVPLERMMQGRQDNPGRSPWGDSGRGNEPPGPPANRPGQGQGGGPSNNPGQGGGSSNNPGQGGGSSNNPGQGGGPSNNPGQGGGSSNNPGQGGGSSDNPGQGGGPSNNPGQGKK